MDAGKESFFSMSEPVISVNFFFLAAGASTTHPPLMKLKLHMLGTSIVLFQGTLNGFSTSSALRFCLEAKMGLCVCTSFPPNS